MRRWEITPSPSQSASELGVLPERHSSHEQRADAAAEAAADVAAKHLKVLFVTRDR